MVYQFSGTITDSMEKQDSLVHGDKTYRIDIPNLKFAKGSLNPIVNMQFDDNITLFK